jgi:hypothetical protein
MNDQGALGALVRQCLITIFRFDGCGSTDPVFIAGVGQRSPDNFQALVNGGAEEDRTPDLRIANATLSQLSYRPEFKKL